jgi:Low affinity iron permease
MVLSLVARPVLQRVVEVGLNPLSEGQMTAQKSERALFGRFANFASCWLGSAWAFAAAVLVIALWSFSGPVYHFSNTWQLVINTGTTIVTFLMVFIIRNTQSRDASDRELDALGIAYGVIRLEAKARGSKRDPQSNSAV